MTRGRHDNQVCVVTDAATIGHGHHRPLQPVDVLADVMRRSSAERSASETLSEELDRGEDPATLRRLWEQARNHIDSGAGPDRRPELRRLQRLRSELPAIGGTVAANQRAVERLDRRVLSTRQDLTTAQAEIEALTRRRWFHRPDRDAIAQTDYRIDADQRQLQRLHNERSTAVRQLEHSRARLHDAERAVARIPEVETAITHRRQWLLSHPAELQWEHDLAARLEQTGRGQAEWALQPDDRDVEPGIDLRTIDLFPRHPQSGLERQLWETIGIHRAFPDSDVALPPLPGRGIDGPDLGR